MVSPVRDPELLARLNGQEQPRPGPTLAAASATVEPVRDPALLAALNGEDPAAPEPDAPVEFSAGEMVSNIPSSGKQYLGDILETVKHPIQTGKAIVGIAGEAMSGDMAGFIGGKVREQIHGQDEGAEAPPMAAGLYDALVERYGSVDSAKTTLMQDPVGVLADLAGGGALTGTKQGRRVAQVSEPLAATHAGAKGATRAAASLTNPVKIYQKAAKFSTTLDEGQRTKIIQTALDHGVMPTHKGLAKVDNKIQILNNTIDDLVAASTATGESIPTRTLVRHIADLKKNRGGYRYGAGADLDQIDKMVASLYNDFINRGKTRLTADELQTFKREAYKDINWDAQRMTGTPVKEEGLKAMGRGAKDALEEMIPEIKGLNQEMGDFLDLRNRKKRSKDHLGKAAGRIENREPFSLGGATKLGAGGGLGYMMGDPMMGMAAGALTVLANQPKVKARLAIVLNKINQNDRTWLEANRSTAEVRLAMALMGRMQDEEASQPTNQ